MNVNIIASPIESVRSCSASEGGGVGMTELTPLREPGVRATCSQRVADLAPISSSSTSEPTERSSPGCTARRLGARRSRSRADRSDQRSAKSKSAHSSSVRPTRRSISWRSRGRAARSDLVDRLGGLLPGHRTHSAWTSCRSAGPGALATSHRAQSLRSHVRSPVTDRDLCLKESSNLTKHVSTPSLYTFSCRNACVLKQLINLGRDDVPVGLALPRTRAHGRLRRLPSRCCIAVQHAGWRQEGDCSPVHERRRRTDSTARQGVEDRQGRFVMVEDPNLKAISSITTPSARSSRPISSAWERGRPTSSRATSCSSPPVAEAARPACVLLLKAVEEGDLAALSRFVARRQGRALPGRADQ